MPLEGDELGRQGLEAEEAFVLVVAPVIEKLVRVALFPGGDFFPSESKFVAR